jgi:hypothetical protein
VQLAGMTTATDTISKRNGGRQHTAFKPRRFLTRRDQAARYGKSVRTIERWGLDVGMGMPAEFDFRGMKARREDELESWERGRVARRV